ncbi:MAG: PstS family phosphate ABC transporter substrate-binding protein [Desulfotignum sp.]|nr:PstS family phosphate ABC transporter substrate-binding protein [Desulfotignum sp.]MCF8086759.1 PstS family phosphate ABC transporter substrate-binding protein [Desulfotignum sp.]MCF8136475.1 PstS family phosphate ABC transporter substrate-binding protein [Desulfotignum sp.]
MKPWFIHLIGLLFAVCCTQLYGCTSPPMEQIVIKGSTTMAPMLERLAAAYQKPGHDQIIIEPTGSLAGIAALIQNDCDMAASSVSAPTKLVQEAEKKGISLKAFPVCRDRIVPIVNTANPLNQLSIKDLRHIFSGKISSWKSYDMADANIQIVLRQTASGTCRMWEQRILNGASPAPGHIQVFSNSGVLAAVAENRYAIGYVSQAYLNHEVKPVEITGHDSETALERTLFLYVNPDHMSKTVKSFLTYLHSGSARQIITDSGFVPITHDN